MAHFHICDGSHKKTSVAFFFLFKDMVVGFYEANDLFKWFIRMQETN